MDILRETLVDLRISEILTREDVVDSILSYFDRRDDHEQIRSAIQARFGVGIKSTVDPNNSAASIETYVKKDFDIKIDNGMVEAISVGFGNRIIDALATLFSETGSRFSLHHDLIEDLEEQEEIIGNHRSAGGFDVALVDADRKSIQCGSAAILVGYYNGHLTYQVLDPSMIRLYFSSYVEVDGVTRPVDNTDIEDATAVVIRLNQVDIDRWNYQAIFGRSTIYPNGRSVMYQDSRHSTKIPEPYSEGCIEYDELTGAPCNPLSWLASINDDMQIPEYPIVIINGGITSDGALPVTTSLYDDCIEVDVMSSRVMSVAGDAARGTNIFKRLHDGQHQPLPRTTIGDIVLPAGVDFEHVSHEPSAAQIGFDVLKDLMVNIAAGYGVPDYMAVPKEYGHDESSGVALEIKTRPLKKNRDRRIKLNSHNVKKLFDVEKSYVKLYDEENSQNDVLFDCEQLWNPSELRMPENKQELANRIAMLLDKGLIDTIEAIREYHRLSSDAEAIQIYEKMKDRATDYPSLAQPAKKTLGLVRNMQ